MKRYSDDELLAMLDDIESTISERKESANDIKKISQAVCAFANDITNTEQAGVLFIGINDQGVPVDLSITEKLLNNLASLKTNGNILPPPTLSVEKRLLKGAEIAVVTVMPSDMPPVRYEGRIWLRSGPSRNIATEQDERILGEKRLHKNKSFDLHPVPSASLNELSRLYFEVEYLPAVVAADILEANNRTYEEKLSSTKMITSPTDTTPTVLGLLVAGKSTQDFLPGAFIQFLRINGLEITDGIIDDEKIGGTIVDLLRKMQEKLKAHNHSAINIGTEPTHITHTQYPLPALYQIIYNAVQHRTYDRTNTPIRVTWYNDRLEILSPGGPYGMVQVGNFGQPGINDYRNPNISAAMKSLGFVQSFGRGIATARNELKKNGNRDLEFEVNENYVLCTIWR